MQFEHKDASGLAGNEQQAAARNQAQNQTQTARANVAGANGIEDNPYASMNISRNSPCPCGSGLKYKQCHGKI